MTRPANVVALPVSRPQASQASQTGDKPDGASLATTGSNGPQNASDASIFELRDVSFALPERTLLRSLTLTLPARRVIGLIGHNGSGKSTLIKILARQQPASGGQILFEGKPLDQWPTRVFAQKLAYLPQHTPSAAGILVRELVAFGRYPWRGALGRFTEADRAKVDEAMALTDVTGFADRLVDTLSGGERQRVWLAMLIAQDADYLLLDEPISALDVAHQVEVLSLVQRLSTERGIGIIVVLHDVNMAARYCDEIVALHGGRLIAQGTPEEILTPAQLQAIYGISMGVMRHPDTGEPVSYVR
ncbi:ATP-binding cassette domain-containing protein [Paraburkholderia fungorum]|uniref:ATP-binding cassette domain-containing protein n=1 Tax=Paraburkholderia fungorum TaxID=134537 RepID=UPI000E7752F0|nr:ATP-binding cassette domain-containing protein [Paraburkholderia fungorum]